VTAPAPLLEWLLANLNESKSKVKATLQNRGIKVNGKCVTQFDHPLKAGDKISVSKSKKNGISYNIAPEATVVVSALSGKISEGKYLFPQFGYATAFPAKMFDKPTTSVVLTKYGTIDYIK